MQGEQETQVRPLGWEDPLEEEMAAHFSILACKFHGQRSLAGYAPWATNSWIQLSTHILITNLRLS